MIKEDWKPVKNYEGLYEVSNLGNVVSLAHGKRKARRPQKTRRGYHVVTLHKNGIQRTVLVHRAVAEAFVPNPDLLPFVNHIDEDKSNNKVDNLEWCTMAYNNNYGTRNERIGKTQIDGKKCKSIIAILPDGTKEKYSSLKEAAILLTGKSHTGNLSSALHGLKKSAYGRKWVFAND